MKDGKAERKERPAVLRVLAYALWSSLCIAGILLLACDIDDSSALVQGIGYLFAFVVTKGAAVAVLWLGAWLYKRWNGLTWDETEEES